jgi:hypothetical protein
MMALSVTKYRNASFIYYDTTCKTNGNTRSYFFVAMKSIEKNKTKM